MFLAWLHYRSHKNAGIADPAWALCFTAASIIYLFMDGDIVRKLLITIMSLTWSLRLTGHLLHRYLNTNEDPRYIKVQENWKDRMLLLFLFQGGIAWLLSFPYLISNADQAVELHTWEYLGFLIWLVGFIGESRADTTLRQFKSKESNKGKVCQEGLWRYSRHPNYFFEWVVWMGFFTFCMSSPYGYLMIYCPFLILHLLLRVSGIPKTEAQLLKSKGEAYRLYQQNTSYFIPFFSKNKNCNTSKKVP